MDMVGAQEGEAAPLLTMWGTKTFIYENFIKTSECAFDYIWSDFIKETGFLTKFVQ